MNTGGSLSSPQETLPSVWPHAVRGSSWKESASLSSAKLHGSVLEKYIASLSWSALRGRLSLARKKIETRRDAELRVNFSLRNSCGEGTTAANRRCFKCHDSQISNYDPSIPKLHLSHHCPFRFSSSSFSLRQQRAICLRLSLSTRDVSVLRCGTSSSPLRSKSETAEPNGCLIFWTSIR